MAKSFEIGGHLIGGNEPAFVIAEASVNHNGDIEMAKEMVRVAKKAGADCIKFQTFTPEEFCADRTKTFTYQSQGKEVTEIEFDMFKRLEFTRDEWATLIEYCKAEEIIFLTTVQDPVNLTMLQDIGLPGIKVGSDDFDHLQNLTLYAKTGLPLIISKGMSDLGELDRVINTVQPLTDKLAILHCVSLYPTDPKLLNIGQIPVLAKLYNEIVWGFSDHSLGTLASTIAVAAGAKLIEKHFTLDHDLPGPDHWFSMDPEELTTLVKDIRFAEAALGSGKIIPATGELESKTIMRRRIVAKQDLPAGKILDENDIVFKRASSGVFVGHWEIIQGNRLLNSRKKNEGIGLGDVAFSN